MNLPNNVIIRFIAISILSIVVACPIIALNKILGQDLLIALFTIVFFVVFNVLYYFSTPKTTYGSFLTKKEWRISLQFREILILIILQVLVELLLAAYSIFFPEPSFVGSHKSVVNILSIIVVAPIIEEWIFRGVLLKSLLTRYSAKKSIVISSLFFALIHIDPIRVIAAFVIGYYLGVVYVRRKSVANVIILHSIANLLGLISMRFLPDIVRLTER